MRDWGTKFFLWVNYLQRIKKYFLRNWGSKYILWVNYLQSMKNTFWETGVQILFCESINCRIKKNNFWETGVQNISCESIICLVLKKLSEILGSKYILRVFFQTFILGTVHPSCWYNVLNITYFLLPIKHYLSQPFHVKWSCVSFLLHLQRNGWRNLDMKTIPNWRKTHMLWKNSSWLVSLKCCALIYLFQIDR